MDLEQDYVLNGNQDCFYEEEEPDEEVIHPRVSNCAIQWERWYKYGAVVFWPRYRLTECIFTSRKFSFEVFASSGDDASIANNLKQDLLQDNQQTLVKWKNFLANKLPDKTTKQQYKYLEAVLCKYHDV